MKYKAGDTLLILTKYGYEIVKVVIKDGLDAGNFYKILSSNNTLYIGEVYNLDSAMSPVIKATIIKPQDIEIVKLLYFS